MAHNKVCGSHVTFAFLNQDIVIIFNNIRNDKMLLQMLKHFLVQEYVSVLQIEIC